MKRKKAFIEIYDDDGNIIKKIPMTAADDDWIGAGRLRKQAEQGDMDAAEQLREMENTQMYYYEDESDDESDKMFYLCNEQPMIQHLHAVKKISIRPLCNEEPGNEL